MLICVNALIIPEYALLVLFPLLGYLGCRFYNSKLLTVYLAYCLLEVLGGIASLFMVERYVPTGNSCRTLVNSKVPHMGSGTKRSYCRLFFFAGIYGVLI